VPPAGQSADDEEDEYEPDPTGVADAAKFGAAVPTERVVVDIDKLHHGLSVAAAEAVEEKQKVQAQVAVLDDMEAEFSDDSEQEVMLSFDLMQRAMPPALP
jgi:hypothetical protein